MPKEKEQKPAGSALDQHEKQQGKSTPTPKRKESEAKNIRPLVSNDSKERRARNRELQERARLGMERGEEKYFPERDKGPQKKFIRQYIDARYCVGELVIPVTALVLIALLFGQNNIYIQVYSALVLYAYILGVIVDSIYLAFRIRHKLVQKFGADQLQKGLRWYAITRAVQFRRLRLPKPNNKRGEYPI